MKVDFWKALKFLAVLLLAAGLAMGYFSLNSCQNPSEKGVGGFDLGCFTQYAAFAIILSFAGVIAAAFSMRKSKKQPEPEKPAALHFYKP